MATLPTDTILIDPDLYTFLEGINDDAAEGSMTVNEVTAAGSSISDAAALGYGFNAVTNDNAAKGVKLPTPVAGKVVFIKHSAVDTNIYPHSASGTINGGSAGAAIDSDSTSTGLMFVATDGTNWTSLFFVAAG